MGSGLRPQLPLEGRPPHPGLPQKRSHLPFLLAAICWDAAEELPTITERHFAAGGPFTLGCEQCVPYAVSVWPPAAIESDGARWPSLGSRLRDSQAD